MRSTLALTVVLALSCSRGSAAPGSDEHGVSGSSASGGAGASASAGSDAAGAGTGPTGGALSQGGNAGNAPDFAPLANDTESGVFVHLFEWRWPDIARECETFLGPQGFTAVQVSPPSEHALLPSNGYPWWQRYQTVSYALESRSGTREQFADMVARCRAAGVGIYVDAVLNHTTAQSSGLGSAGTKFTKYAYPDLYAAGDFHTPTCQIQGSDYATSAEHVQRCELVGLADLDTGSESVQAKLAAYLSELVALGVRGFRIDAAKHVAAAEVAAILAQVAPAHGEQPYYFLEVIDPGGEAVLASDYLDVGGDAELDITEFRYAGVGDAFLGRDGKTLASLRELSETGWSLLPADRSVVFVANHDTQRADAPLFQDGPAHDLATVFMLAFPYGYPSVMSSYGFDRETGSGRDQGPPSDGSGHTRPVYELDDAAPSCAAPPFTAATRGWICEHRARYVSSMVAFRKATTGAPVANFWDNGQNQLAFSRGALGFVVLNHEQVRLEQTLQTGLPEGQYCNVLSEDFVAAAGSPGACGAGAVEVDSSGMAALSLPPESALALHVEARLAP